MSSSSFGVRGSLRALVRQIAAAVYAWVAYALIVAALRPESPWSVIGLRVLLVFGAGAALAAIVEGPFWTVALVGVFTAAFDLALAWIATDPEAGGSALADPQLLGVNALTVLAGVGGALLVRRRRARTTPSSAPSKPPPPAA